MFNVDYKVDLFYALQRRQHTWRLRFYHLSSHLGDDYVIRNNIGSYFPNANNYEQLDVLYSVQHRRWRLYGGGGSSLRTYSERKPLYFQAGAFYRGPGERNRWVAGLDARTFQQWDFTPGIHAAAGIEVGKIEARPLSFLLEIYAGKLPYSPQEGTDVAWVGAGVYFNPF